MASTSKPKITTSDQLVPCPCGKYTIAPVSAITPVSLINDRVSYSAKTKDGRKVTVLEVVTFRRRNVHVRFKDGSTAWIAQEDFNPRLPNEVPDSQ